MAAKTSRRVFMARAAVAASALALPTLAIPASNASPHRSSNGSNDEVLDLAIIGAGVSGVYCGWRLLSADPTSLRILGRPVSGGRPLRVKVYEGSLRVGGRLLSARAVGSTAICDLGGMRFVSSQKRVSGLIDALQLPHHRFYTSHSQNHAFLRGKHLRVSDLTNPALLPYQLSPAEQNCVEKYGPDLLIQCGLTQLLPGLANLHGEELNSYLQAAQIDGAPLYQYGLWNLLARTLTAEARALVQATIGFDTIGSNANAVDLITQYLTHTPDVTYHALDGGYDALPWALQRKFESAGGEIMHGAWLRCVSPLTLGDGTLGVRLSFRGGCPAVSARGVILAMPRRSLEMIFSDCSWLAPSGSVALSRLLGSVAFVPLSKCFIRYPRAWWKATGVCQGCSLTDLPIRQCWYWTESHQQGCGPDNDEALIMVYNDAASVAFWEGLRPSESQVVPSAGAACGVQGLSQDDNVRLRDNWRTHDAPVEMVAELHRQVLALHDVQSAPKPLDAIYVDWSDDPFGAGVHLWNRGAQSWRTAEEMTQPIEDFPCYVCGEAYSTMQTWVEGALQAADMVLQQRLSLPARGIR